MTTKASFKDLTSMSNLKMNNLYEYSETFLNFWRVQKGQTEWETFSTYLGKFVFPPLFHMFQTHGQNDFFSLSIYWNDEIQPRFSIIVSLFI